MNKCLIMGSPLVKKCYDTPDKRKEGLQTECSPSNSSRFANAPIVMRESNASNGSSIHPTSFKDNDSIKKDLLRLGMFERSVEEPSARLPDNEEQKTNATIWQGFNSKLEIADDIAAQEERKSDGNELMKDAHAKITIADADSDDSEDDSVDDHEASFMTSRYESTYEDDISEGSGYQEL